MTNVQLREELFRDSPKIRLDDLKIPEKLRRKRGCIRLTEEDIKDERIQYIVNR